MNTSVNITCDLSDHQALALAQFVKRVGWREFRTNAVELNLTTLCVALRKQAALPSRKNSIPQPSLTCQKARLPPAVSTLFCRQKILHRKSWKLRGLNSASMNEKGK